MSNIKNEDYKVLDWNLSLIHIWNENHPKDLEAILTCEIHEISWRSWEAEIE
jgi:hypothetical protein